MKFRHWDINTRTQIISLGPALLLTALLISFFTFVRIQDLPPSCAPSSGRRNRVSTR